MLEQLQKKAAAPERVRAAIPKRTPPAIPKPKPYRPVSDLSVVAAKVGTLDADDLCTVADALTGDATALAAAAERLDTGDALAPTEPLQPEAEPGLSADAADHPQTETVPSGLGSFRRRREGRDSRRRRPL